MQRYEEHDELPSEDEAYDMGFQAAFDGCSDTDNPFPVSTNQHLSWNDGYASFHSQQDDHAADGLRQAAAALPGFVAEQVETLLATSMAAIGERIGVPVAEWPGRCFEIASKIIEAFEWEDAYAVYGHYRGQISARCALFRGKPVVHHGWILLESGVIVDPTRWVFEAQTPYIAVFKPWESAHRNVFLETEYDEGGEIFNEQLRGPRPAFDASSKTYGLAAGAVDAESLRGVIGRLFGMLFTRETVSLDEARWLAKTPYSTLGSGAEVLYPWLSSVGLRALIPIDLVKRANRDGVVLA
ncbi:hypothetical protein [Burkholderia cenocepacia]|uniref:hypothetical protein n=1 Tax=Burkholderia cenocepacia TaxID=95486 RepID=UPI000ABD5318|nr:hypothetical protein [Burkholderia cenocepacia]